jgi:hypothetical protein
VGVWAYVQVMEIPDDGINIEIVDWENIIEKKPKLSKPGEFFKPNLISKNYNL